MKDINLNNFGGMINTHSDGIGLPREISSTTGYGVHGSYNIKWKITESNWAWFRPIVVGNGYLGTLNRFAKEITDIVVPVKHTEYQPIQIISSAVPCVQKDVYETEEVKEPAFFGLFSKKVSRVKKVGKAPHMLSELLDNFAVDEPVYRAEWLIPSFMGCKRDRRGGMFFIFTLALGESDAKQLNRSFSRNKDIIRQIGEAMFPVQFKALGECLPYAQLPRYLFDSTDECLRKPGDAPCALKKI